MPYYIMLFQRHSQGTFYRYSFVIVAYEVHHRLLEEHLQTFSWNLTCVYKQGTFMAGLLRCDNSTNHENELAIMTSKNKMSIFPYFSDKYYVCKIHCPKYK